MVPGSNRVGGGTCTGSPTVHLDADQVIRLVPRSASEETVLFFMSPVVLLRSLLYASFFLQCRLGIRPIHPVIHANCAVRSGYPIWKCRKLPKVLLLCLHCKIRRRTRCWTTSTCERSVCSFVPRCAGDIDSLTVFASVDSSSSAPVVGCSGLENAVQLYGSRLQSVHLLSSCSRSGTDHPTRSGCGQICKNSCQMLNILLRS